MKQTLLTQLIAIATVAYVEKDDELYNATMVKIFNKMFDEKLNENDVHDQVFAKTIIKTAAAQIFDLLDDFDAVPVLVELEKARKEEMEKKNGHN